MPRNQIEIEVTADSTRARRELKGLSDDAKALDLNFRKVATGAGVAVAAFAGIAFSAKAFIDVAREQQNAMATLQQVTNNTGIAFAAYESQILRTTGALQEVTNFGDEFQQRVLARMIPILGDVDKALQALPLVLDAATVSGADAFSVANTLTKALAGQANMAESVGIKFDEAADFNERLAQTMQAVGGAAAANADPFAQLANDVGDLKEVIGGILIGPATEFVGFLRDSTVLVGELITMFSASGVAFDENGQRIESLTDVALAYRAVQEGLIDDTFEAKAAFLADADALAELRGVSEDTTVDTQRLNDAFLEGLKQNTAFRNAIIGISDGLTDDLQPAFLEAFASTENLTASFQRLEQATQDVIDVTDPEFISAYNQAELERINRAREMRQAMHELRQEQEAYNESLRQAEIDALTAEIEKSLEDQRKVRDHMREGLNAEGIARLKAADEAAKAAEKEEAALGKLTASWDKLTKSVAFANTGAGKMRLTTQGMLNVLFESGVNISDLTREMRDAGIATEDYNEVLKFLEEQGFDVTAMAKQQQQAIENQTRSLREMQKAAREAASAMAEAIAGTAPGTTGRTIIATQRFHTDPIASGIFDQLSELRRRELGTNTMEDFQVFFLDLVKQLQGTGLDRVGAILRAQQSLEGFQSGGVVSGPVGSPQLVLAHGGETILPTHRGGDFGGVTIHNDFSGATILGVDDLDATIRQSVDDAFRRRSRMQGRR